MDFDTIVPPVQEIRPIVKAKEMKPAPETIPPTGGQKDVERIALLDFGLSLGMEGVDFRNPETLRKLKTIREAAIQEAKSEDPEVLQWQAMRFRQIAGAPAMGSGLVDHLYQYSRLLMDRNLIQMQLGSMGQGGFDSPSSLTQTPSMQNSQSRTPTAPSVNILIGGQGL